MKKMILNKVVETIEVEISTPQFRKNHNCYYYVSDNNTIKLMKSSYAEIGFFISTKIVNWEEAFDDGSVEIPYAEFKEVLDICIADLLNTLPL
jgi:hypothetical protein